MTSTRRVPTVALVGRQNAGKTSLLMHLTGTSQHPVNFPGSSVERGEAFTKAGDEVLRVVDLPGITSLEALSPDEAVALDWLDGKGEGDGADVVCAVMDAAKLSVELRLVLALAKRGRPLVVALTKSDVAGVTIDVGLLAARLGVPVLAVNALTGVGKDALLAALRTEARRTTPRTLPEALSADEVVREVTTPHGDLHDNLTDKLDRVLLHRVFGLPILALLLFGIFQTLFAGAKPAMDLIEAGQGALGGWVAGLVPEGALQSFLVDGLINGVGSVLVFLPQIILLMVFVSLLEASGYMARAAFLLDRVLSKVGLSGRSFVPMVSSFACAVPGILSTRMIDNERERLATIAILPLMSCSARLPVYVVLIAAFFPVNQAGLVLFSLYALGVIIAFAVAWILRKTKLRGPYAVLMMELPVYQRPSFKVVWGQVSAAVREFMVMAGTVILATSILIWILSYYPRPEAVHEAAQRERAPIAAELAALGEGPEHAAARASLEARLESVKTREKASYLEGSLLASAGKLIAPIFEPAGFEWRTTVGVLAAFPARELIIPTLGILYRVGDVDPGEFEVASLDATEARKDEGLTGRLRSATREDGSPAWSTLSALAVMVFFALCSQCMATLGAIRRETRSWKWPVFVFTYMTSLAWLMAVLVFQVGSALGLGGGR